TVAPMGTVTGAFRVNNFGWRTGDTKTGVLLGNAGAAVQLIDAASGNVVASYTAGSPLQTDPYSGDAYASVDFTAYATPGDYYLYAPSLNVRSYIFRIADDIYNIVGAASVKA